MRNMSLKMHNRRHFLPYILWTSNNGIKGDEEKSVFHVILHHFVSISHIILSYFFWNYFYDSFLFLFLCIYIHILITYTQTLLCFLLIMFWDTKSWTEYKFLHVVLWMFFFLFLFRWRIEMPNDTFINLNTTFFKFKDFKSFDSIIFNVILLSIQWFLMQNTFGKCIGLTTYMINRFINFYDHKVYNLQWLDKVSILNNTPKWPKGSFIYTILNYHDFDMIHNNIK